MCTYDRVPPSGQYMPTPSQRLATSGLAGSHRCPHQHEPSLRYPYSANTSVGLVPTHVGSQGFVKLALISQVRCSPLQHY